MEQKKTNPDHLKAATTIFLELATGSPSLITSGSVRMLSKGRERQYMNPGH